MAKQIYTEEQKKRRRETARKWAKEHPERVREFGRRDYLKNKEKRYQQSRAWHLAHPERCRELDHESCVRHRKERRLRSQQYRRKHPEKVRECGRRWEERDRQDLGDHYLRKLIANQTGCSARDIPQEVIELKRANLREGRAHGISPCKKEYA